MKYYLNEIEITKQEAHDLSDKTGLIVSDNTLKFEKPKEIEKPKKGGKKK